MLFFSALIQASWTNSHGHHQVKGLSSSPFYEFFLWFSLGLFQYSAVCYLVSLLILPESICTFIVFYIFLPYSRPEFSSFFLIWYYIPFMWLSIQLLTQYRWSSLVFWLFLLNILVSHLSMRLISLRRAFLFDSIILFQNGSSFFLFFYFFYS